jgi:4-hydroxybenzoate polyprenyltransferase
LTPPPTSDSRAAAREARRQRLQQVASAALREAKELVPRDFSPAAWLRLVRLPNLLTVPGDLLAGFLLAPAASALDWGQFLLLAIPSGLGLYAAGLILNDLFGYAEDMRERPWRPLPTGQVSRENAAAAAMILVWVAAFAAAFFDALPIALPLILCIVLYNIGLKRVSVLGPLLMGACRAGNLLLGAAAIGDGLTPAPAPIAGALALGLYIAAVTHLARNEAKPGARFTPRHIARLLRLLIPLQALLCLAAIHHFPANLLGLALLPLLPLHQRLSRTFPPS